METTTTHADVNLRAIMLGGVLEAEQCEMLILFSPAELALVVQGLVARKKILRAKIRNNQGHLKRMDMPGWTAADLNRAIGKRKLELADTDILLTRLMQLSNK